jgi:hypothetical protein
MRNIKKLVATVVATGALSFGAAPVLAAPQGGPVVTGGLVNVTIVDAVDINHNTVQLPIAVAANVCDVNIAVLVAELDDPGGATCDARAGSQANA